MSSRIVERRTRRSEQPTAALDRKNADALGADLVRLAADGGRTLITVTHDVTLARRMDRTITLADGKVIGDTDG
jgi:ABC-type lipoprotein export system ATPase subunit